LASWTANRPDCGSRPSHAAGDREEATGISSDTELLEYATGVLALQDDSVQSCLPHRHGLRDIVLSFDLDAAKRRIRPQRRSTADSRSEAELPFAGGVVLVFARPARTCVYVDQLQRRSPQP